MEETGFTDTAGVPETLEKEVAVTSSVEDTSVAEGLAVLPSAVGVAVESVEELEELFDPSEFSTTVIVHCETSTTCPSADGVNEMTHVSV